MSRWFGSKQSSKSEAKETGARPDVEAEQAEDEEKEERKAAEGGYRKLTVEITDAPKINRNQEGEVTSASFKGKAPFKGEVTLRMRGDVAKAYWSVMPGMKVSARVMERAEKDYEIDTLDIVNQG